MKTLPMKICFKAAVAKNDGKKLATIMVLRIPSSGMWRRVDILLTDVSEESIASIFRI
jgi:hypothetical protein